MEEPFQTLAVPKAGDDTQADHDPDNIDLVQQIQQGSSVATGEERVPARSHLVGDDDDDDDDDQQLAEDPYYKEEEEEISGMAGEGVGVGVGEEPASTPVAPPRKESRKRKRQQAQDDESTPAKAAASAAAHGGTPSSGSSKKKERISNNVTGPDCKCKRFKCFSEKTTEEDREVIIRLFNMFNDYSKEQAYLSSLIEIGEVADRATTPLAGEGDNNGEGEGDGEHGQQGEKQEDENEKANQEEHEHEHSAEPREKPAPEAPEAPAGNPSDTPLNASVDTTLNNSVDSTLDTSADLSLNLSASLTDNMLDSSEPPRPASYKRHAYTVKYFVRLSSNRIRVCQKAFCSMFGISAKRVNLLTHKLHLATLQTNGVHVNGSAPPPIDLRGRHGHRTKSETHPSIF